jgi:hypothetical protein
LSGVRAKVVCGLPKEVEEDLDKFLSSQPLRVLHVGQSESQDRITVTLLFEPIEADLVLRPESLRCMTEEPREQSPGAPAREGGEGS